MTNLVRCKACGFITTADQVKKHCPACGLDAKVFEAYQEKISPKRHHFLAFHIHPIGVHFPQALAPALLLLLISTFIFQNDLKAHLEITTQVLMKLYPFTVVLAFISGLFDGKVRFKRVKTPILKQKIIIGSVFIGMSILVAILTRYWPNNLIITVLLFLLLVGTLICAAFLGKKGASLLCSALPN